MESGSKIQCAVGYTFLPYYACSFNQPIKKIVFFTVARATRNDIFKRVALGTRMEAGCSDTEEKAYFCVFSTSHVSRWISVYEKTTA